MPECVKAAALDTQLDHLLEHLRADVRHWLGPQVGEEMPSDSRPVGGPGRTFMLCQNVPFPSSNELLERASRACAIVQGIYVRQPFLQGAFGQPSSFVLREEGVSGTKDLENRPALQELVIALHSNGVSLVLIEKPDRLARDLMIQESIIADMERNGFELRSVAEPDLCSHDPSRTLIRQILGAFTQYERSTIVNKLRGARARTRAKLGRCEGRKPYGTRPGEAEVIARMKQLRSQGFSLATITDTLNRQAKPRTGKQFYAANVARILKAAGAVVQVFIFSATLLFGGVGKGHL